MAQSFAALPTCLTKMIWLWNSFVCLQAKQIFVLHKILCRIQNQLPLCWPTFLPACLSIEFVQNSSDHPQRFTALWPALASVLIASLLNHGRIYGRPNCNDYSGLFFHPLRSSTKSRSRQIHHDENSHNFRRDFRQLMIPPLFCHESPVTTHTVGG